MKYFAFSDAHGDCDALMRAVQRYAYEQENSNHTLISLGDNFGRADRGAGSKGIYEYLTSSKHRNKPICLTGNHELILRSILFKRDLSISDVFNGENKTLYSFLGKNLENDAVTPYDIDVLSRSPLMDWLLSLPYYFETPHFIFLHGFLPFDYNNLNIITDEFVNVSEETWKNASWCDTPSMIRKFEQQCPTGLYDPDGKRKNVVFGHWHNRQLRDSFGQDEDCIDADSIYQNEKLGLFGLDCCTFYSHKVDMLVLED